MKKPRRYIVRIAQAPVAPRVVTVSVRDITMAYTALLGDPTTRLTGKSVQASDIQSWLDDQYGDGHELGVVQVAMKEYRRSAGAAVR